METKSKSQFQNIPKAMKMASRIARLLVGTALAMASSISLQTLVEQ
jgi:hypothetical protein